MVADQEITRIVGPELNELSELDLLNRARADGEDENEGHAADRCSPHGSTGRLRPYAKATRLHEEAFPSSTNSYKEGTPSAVTHGTLVALKPSRDAFA